MYTGAFVHTVQGDAAHPSHPFHNFLSSGAESWNTTEYNKWKLCIFKQIQYVKKFFRARHTHVTFGEAHNSIFQTSENPTPSLCPHPQLPQAGLSALCKANPLIPSKVLNSQKVFNLHKNRVQIKSYDGIFKLPGSLFATRNVRVQYLLSHRFMRKCLQIDKQFCNKCIFSVDSQECVGHA